MTRGRDTTPASPEDCPCCHGANEDLDRSMVQAFLGGVFARDSETSMGAALCAKHGAIAKDCLLFVHQNISGEFS